MHQYVRVAAFTAALAMPALAFAGSHAEAIHDAVGKFEAAYNAGDSTALARLYTADGALFPPGAGRVDGIDGIAAFWQSAMESGLADIDLETTELDARGDVATEIGRFTGTVPDGEGGTAPVAGKYVVIWKRDTDGRWRLHRDIWNTGQ